MFVNDTNELKRSFRDGSDIKATEHATIKVPYEILNKKYRTSQRTIEREISQLNQSVSQLKRSSSLEQANQALDSVVARLNVLKRKADESISDEIEAASLCKRRLEHLRCGVKYQDQISLNIWKDKRLERLLVDHMLRSGYYDTAIKLAQAGDIKSLTNIEIFLAYKEVEESLASKDVSKCLLWCQENKSKLRKIDSTLEFNLRQQEFIELIRANKRVEAIFHSRKYLSPALTEDCTNNIHCQLRKRSTDHHHSIGDFHMARHSSIKSITSRFSQRNRHRYSHPLYSSMSADGDFNKTTTSSCSHNYGNFMSSNNKQASSTCPCIRNERVKEEIELTMGLLAYEPDTKREPYKSMFSDNRWTMLIDQFKRDTYSVFQFNTVSVFAVTLQAGLSALKTPHCYRKSGQRDNDCPICNPPLDELAKSLPFPHCSQSKLICSISGQPINENNPPLVLPNGHIYGEMSLRLMASKNEGLIICPKTREVYNFDRARKVYVM